MSLRSGYGKIADLTIAEENQIIVESLLIKINKILEIVMKENKELENYNEKLLSQQKMSFNTNNIPNITIQKYLERIFKYTEAEESTFIIALIYIDRINQISNIIITPYNIHRIIFISVLLAIKYNEDITFDFDYYAQVAGISIDELKSLRWTASSGSPSSKRVCGSSGTPSCLISWRTPRSRRTAPV